MRVGDKVLWGNLLVVILSFAETKARIKLIGKTGRGNEYEVPFSQLKQNVQKIEKLPGHLDCPDCGLSYPNYRSGIECPACHFKESVNFRKYIGMFNQTHG